MHLPEKFQKEMETLLGDEYQAFKESYDRQPENGLRLNRRKVTGEEFLTRSPFLLKKIPWIDNGRTGPVHRRKIRIIMRDCIICRNRVQ